MIVAMGTQGVLVETPNGLWNRVGVGPYFSTDMSAVARTKLLTNTPLFWVSTLALSVFAAASASLLTVARRREIAGAIAIAGGIVVAACVFYWGLFDLSSPLLAIAVVAVPAMIVLALLLIRNRRSYRRKTQTLVVAGMVLIGAVFVFPGLREYLYMAFLSWISVLFVLALPTASVVLLALLLVWKRDTSRRKSLALVVVGFALAGTVFVFPGFPDSLTRYFFRISQFY